MCRLYYNRSGASVNFAIRTRATQKSTFVRESLAVDSPSRFQSRIRCSPRVIFETDVWLFVGWYVRDNICEEICPIRKERFDRSRILRSIYMLMSWFLREIIIVGVTLLYLCARDAYLSCRFVTPNSSLIVVLCLEICPITINREDEKRLS